MSKKKFIPPLVVVFFMVIQLSPLTAMGFGTSGDLCRIVSPGNYAVIDYYPVKIRVDLKGQADTSTFKAWLNGANITGRFKPVTGGMEALVLPSDGLRYRVIGEDPRFSRINILTTWVKGSRWSFDLDMREFSVEYHPVATARDDKGVWFITGGCLYDVFEAMGYALAEDRLWQMEVYRRTARGRLCEIFGIGQLQSDVYMRTIGYTDVQLAAGYEALDLETKIMLDGYTDGINNRIDEILGNEAPLPFEFAKLKFTPAYWTPEDVLAWETLMLREFDCEALEQGQINNAALIQKLMGVYGQGKGYGMFNDLRWINDPDALTYIHPAAGVLSMAATAVTEEAAADMEASGETPGISAYDYDAMARKMGDRQDEIRNGLEKINARVQMGSYAWVVSG
ncbi:penicillin acylase family protein, partial [bacterium]|nr:penicillin acylase family protein [bacterium]